MITAIKTGSTNTYYLKDSTTGNEISVYGLYINNLYSYANEKFSYDYKNGNQLDSSIIDKKVTVSGIVVVYKNSPQLKNTVLLSASEEKVDANVTVSEVTNGTVALDKESYKVGETVTITATSAEGYKVSKVEVTIDGTTSDLTADDTYSFSAGINNTVSVEFVSSSEKTNQYIECAFTKDKFSDSISNYTSGWSINTEVPFAVANFNNNKKGWDFIRGGSQKTASVATLTTSKAAEQEINSISVTIDSITAEEVNSIKLEVSPDATFPKESTQTFEVTKAKGAQKTTITTPTANAYYRYTFDCAKGSANGFVQISGITFTYLG